MAVLHNTTATIALTAGAAGVTNRSLTIAANANRYLIVHVLTFVAASGVPNGAASVTWNGSEPLTLLWQNTANAASSAIRLQAWGLKNPSAGSANVTVTNGSGTITGGAVIASSYYGVNQTTPTGTARSANVSPRVATANEVGGLAVGAAARALNADGTPGLTEVNGNPLNVEPGTPATSASATTLTPALPATTAPARGSFVLAICSSKNNATHNCATTGWNKLRQTNSGAAFTTSVWYAQVPDSNVLAAPVITWTGAAACHAYTYHYHDCLGTIAGLSAVATGTTATHATASGNSTATRSKILYIDTCAAATALGLPSSWTENVDVGANGIQTVLGNRDLIGSGSASGAISVTGGAAAWVQQQLELFACPPQIERASQLDAAANRAVLQVDEEAYAPFNHVQWSSTGGVGTGIPVGVIALLPAPDPVTVTATGRHDNAQEFYAPTVTFAATGTFIDAPYHINAQAFYAPSIKRTVAPSLHTNVQVLYAPTRRQTVLASARFDNAQAFYPPALKAKLVAPLHTNLQVLHAPKVTVRFAQTVLHTNAQTFYPPKRTAAVKLALLHTNVQAFYSPSVLHTRTILAPLHTNVQVIYTPARAATVKQAARHDNAQAFLTPHRVTVRLVQTARHDNAQTFYTPLAVNRVGTGILAPQHVNLQAFYPAKIHFALTAPLHTNLQAFYSARVAALAYVAPPLHTNLQAFYPPSVRVTVKPSRHDNAQTFYPLRLKATVRAPRLINAQDFFAPKVTVRLTQSARHDNAQTFYPPARRATVTAILRHNNVQVFYPPAVTVTVRAPLHTNAQQFYPPKITRGIVPALHTNAQTFYPLTLGALYKVTARFDNEQEFFAPGVAIAAPDVVLAPFHENAQEFYGAALVFTEAPQRDPARGVRIFEDARFEFCARARVTEFSASRQTEFDARARVTEFTGQRRLNVFRSRLIVEGELIL